ncbi:MAG: flagellar basal body L-ring protein FlgH [Micavibrio aeruginosavorus]|uniref:Flagellar L-ring protein n=1 Tax=Micavibrio aeruginosavorus TaxID=349221 RepID=A0A7T5UHD7_9BACT|nr:MAG: flagellar basal body L-ring protein FlgH [Micavibrio aeruginosavorus]
MKKANRISGLALMLATSTLLTACGSTMDRLAQVGQPPEMTQIVNPHLQNGYQPVSMPMPAPKMVSKQPNSLWQSDSKTFFKDQRATQVGDILTVLVDIEDEADIENKTQRSRNSKEGVGIDNMLGFETALDQVLPTDVDNANLVGFDSNTTTKGDGKIEREESVKLRLAAVVTQLLPNGNMVIQGNQEVRVNFEKRILNVTGIIRPQDISIDNTVTYDQIAEARIVYGGEGHVTDLQQPRYGQQVYDILMPF